MNSNIEIRPRLQPSNKEFNNEKIKTDTKLIIDAEIILLSSDSEAEDVKYSKDNVVQRHHKKHYSEISSTINSEKPPGDVQPIKIEPEHPKKLEDNNNGQSDVCCTQTNASKPPVTTEVDHKPSPEKKPIRPFQIYPSYPFDVIAGFDTAKLHVTQGAPEGYDEFRRRMMDSRYHRDRSGINRNMSRFHTFQTSDIFYTEKRKKNNLAAKKSRDARKTKEDELAVRCAFLEQENSFLKRQLAEVQEENKNLKNMLNKAGPSVSSCDF